MQPHEIKRKERSLLAVNLGLFTNIVLASLKTSFGVLGHSPALLADGINSTSDVAYSLVVRIFMGLAQKPADEEHPYGHRQLESIAALMVGAFVITTGIAIFWDSVNKVFDLWSGASDFRGASLAALAVGLLTVAVKMGLAVFTRRVGRQFNNPAILALASDHANDIAAASAASLGILLGRMGLAWVDPLAGALVALFVLRTGVSILRESSGDLMDTVPGEALRREVGLALRDMSGVMQIEELLAHRFGPYLVINLVIGIDGGLSVAQGDAISTQVEQTLCNSIDLLQRVHIHYHPAKFINST